MIQLHVHLHIAELSDLLDVGRQILHKLSTMETNMPTIADLNDAVDNVKGVLSANDARVATLVNTVSEAAASDAVHDAALEAEIKRLNDLIAAGGDPAAIQAVMDKVTAMAAQGTAQGAAIDEATTALAAAFPKP